MKTLLAVIALGAVALVAKARLWDEIDSTRGQEATRLSPARLRAWPYQHEEQWDAALSHKTPYQSEYVFTTADVPVYLADGKTELIIRRGTRLHVIDRSLDEATVEYHGFPHTLIWSVLTDPAVDYGR